MIIYDDATDCSGTITYGAFWYSAEPNSYRWTVGPLMRESGVNFIFCASCLAYCDAMDVVTGDFAELHCSYCGSTDLCLGDLENE